MKHAVLSDRALVKIAGADAEHFLENLVTCKVAGLQKNEAVFGALLTPQGKIMFDFFLQKVEDGYQLDIANDTAADLVKRLMFYRLRAKVDISAPKQVPVHAYWDCNAQDWQNYLIDPRYQRMGFRVYGEEETVGEARNYIEHRIEVGIPQGGTDFKYSEAYPHETLMDQFNGVDFKKGCYVGQEVVSRMQHRATVKKRIVKVSTDTSLPEPGTPVTADGKPAGELGSVLKSSGLAMVRLDRVARAKQVLAGVTAISIEIPAWASFSMPEVAG